jgi:hypothetical protein
MNKEQILKAFPTFQNVFEDDDFVFKVFDNNSILIKEKDGKNIILIEKSLHLLEQVIEKSREIRKGAQ